VAKVFAVDEAAKPTVGHLRVVEASELSKVKKFSDVTEETFEYRLAAGKDSNNVMKLSGFIGLSAGYVPVSGKEAKKVKAEFKLNGKDEKVALYTDEKGKTTMFISREKALELMEGKKIEGLVMPKASKEKLEEIFGKAVFGGKLGGKIEKLERDIVDGVIKPNDINRQLAYVLRVWKNAGEMMDRIGVKEGYGVKEITEGYYKAAGEVVKSGMSVQEVNIEIKLLSTIRDLLITLEQSSNKQELLEIVNKEKIDMKDFDKLSASLKVSKAVNHNTIVETLGTLKAEGGKEDFIIDIEALKKAIETKTSTSKRIIEFFNDKNKPEDILPMLGGDKLKEKARGMQMTPMMIRSVAASA
jgi:hypothetical protein